MSIRFFFTNGEVSSILKKIKPFVKEFFERADIFLLCVCLICSFISLYGISKATATMAAGGVSINPTKCLIVQIISIFIGIGAFVLFTVIDGDILGQQWRWLVVINVLLLVALVVLGSEDDTGNKSWIRFAGIGIQPSEVIKILYVIINAKHITYLKEYKDLSSLSSVVQVAANFGLVFIAIVFVSSDLGSASIILSIFLVMLFAAGVKLYWFAIGGAALAAVIPVLWTSFLKDYQRKRLLAPYDPTIDPDGWGITWQTTQSKLSLKYGRFTGAASDHTSNVFTGKHTDFIFACIGEHLGMLGGMLVILLLIVIIVRCFKTGLYASRTYDMLICFGVGSAIAFQTFINIGMCIGITPVIGITLPFFSYGGSSMVTLFGAVGLVSGVRYKPKPTLFSLG